MKNIKAFISACLLVFIISNLYLYCVKADDILPYDRLNKLGILIGPGTGITEQYLDKPLTRIDAAILVLKLMGLINEAEVYDGDLNFLDSNSALSDYSVRIMGYLKANPSLGFIGYLDKFDPNGVIDDQMMYKVLLSILGYRQGIEFEWVETNVMAMLAGMSVVSEFGPLTIRDAAAAIVEALLAEVKDSGELLIQILVNEGIISVSMVQDAGWEFIAIQ